MGTFRFGSSSMQELLTKLYKNAGIQFEQNHDGALVTGESSSRVADSLQSAVRYGRFSDWYTHLVVNNHVGNEQEAGGLRYSEDLREYLAQNNFEFVEEWQDGALWFLLPEGVEIPDTIWETAFDIEVVHDSEKCCCICGSEIRPPVFYEISAHLENGGVEGLFHAHAGCLSKHLNQECAEIISRLGQNGDS